MSDAATISPEKPAAAAAPAEAAINTDAFSQSTRRCSRRAWDIFLQYRNDMALFTGRAVRGRLTFQSADDAHQAAQILRTEGGVTAMTLLNEHVEFTGTLAAVQLVIKQPYTQFFDAIVIQ